MLTGIQLVDTLKASGKKLSEARQLMRKFPQVLVNVRVEDKSKYKDNPVIEEAIASVEQELGITAACSYVRRVRSRSFALWPKARKSMLSKDMSSRLQT